jgi:D-alanyl-D-alanine carboxypeptidase
MLSRLSGITFLLLLAITTEGWPQPTIEPTTDYKGDLINAYPKFLDRIENNELIWKDGTRMPIDDGKGGKSLELLLDEPDIKDMFVMRYPLGEKGIAPEINSDPGRVRYSPLFRKMYGDCRTSNIMANAATVRWLPTKDGKNLEFTKINGASAALQKISDELDKLPDRFLKYLRPTQGTYNCRSIAESKRESPHSFGIAIDIAAAHSQYWLWSKPGPDGRIPYRNEIPWEIVNVFEQHGFIWGGKWYHYDTMHFEYRPEIIAIAK